jgi:predicted Zn-dependent protease
MPRGPALALALLSTAAIAPACSRNPATGKLQFGLVDEAGEIRLGKESDTEIVAAVGEYDETPKATALVQHVGKQIAAKSERPQLPWTFRLLDDPGVNAFALPGGYVYVTRGLMAHLGSDDELAAALAHEIGHVAARHGAVQMRKTATARRSVGLFRVIDPNLQHVGGIAARTAGLALLKYSRDDEHEADDLGLRYITKSGYAPVAIAEVFRVLVSITEAHAGQRVPTWMSTHPEPEARLARMEARLRELGLSTDRPLPEPEYLQAISGIVVGEDPRDGYFLGRTFVHPRAALRIDLPAEWEAVHEDVQVLAMSPDKKALFVLAPAEVESAKKGIDDFFADGSIQRGEGWKGEVGGYPTESAAFAIAGEGGRLPGLLAFVEFEGRVLVLVAIGPEADWSARADAIAQTFASFRKLTEAGLRDVKPMRIALATLPTSTTLKELYAASPSVVSIEEVARLNHVTLDEPLAAGRIVKRVDGFNAALAGGAP